MKPIATLLLVIAALVAAPAATAAPVTIGEGVNPGVTVDAAGTGYIAWIGNEPGTTSLHFCRLPRGAAACDINRPLTVPGTSLSRPFTIVSGSTVRLFSYRYGLTGGPRFAAVYMLTSTDGGATFDAGREIATINPYDAVPGPGNSVSMIEDVSASLFQLAPLDGAGPVVTPARLSEDHPYNPSVAVVDGGTILAVFANGSGEAQYRVWEGAGDANDVATWSPAQTFAPFAGYQRLAAGPTGTFALSDDANGNLVVRRFGGRAAGFGSAVPLPGSAHPITGGSDDMTQDPGGRLHVIWPFGDAQGAHVSYSSSDDGTNWATTTFDAGNPADLNDTPGAMRVSVAADHVGVAVWHSSGQTRFIRAIEIGRGETVPPPVVGKTANAAVVSGKVFVKLPKGASARAAGLGPAQANGFIPLTADTQVPLGSTFDTTKGRVELKTAVGQSKPGRTQTGQFYSGVFSVAQIGGRRNPITQTTLNASLTCPKRGRKVSSAARSRRLWSDARGRYRTRARHSSATVRGTRWLTKDTCTSTTTQVVRGSVTVRDFDKGRTRIVRAGQSYVASKGR